MTSDAYPYPVAVSRLSEGEASREPQNIRAIRWLLEQPGRSVVVVTPRKQIQSDSLQRLAAHTGVMHLTWRGLSTGSLAGHRVLCAWPDRSHLNDLWGVNADALVVIEWNEDETAEWIEDANPVQLFRGETVPPVSAPDRASSLDQLPNGVDQILEHVALIAAGYSSGLKWNEEEMLKSDMMMRSDRWGPITVDQLRAKCRGLGMRPNDVDTVAGLLQRRKDGHRFTVQSTYRGFQFN
ncbi:hypothetical protein [Demequina globuliformis]|uniref:hypothetical protein n=1 Tax=Demequina globuliformis TaxID=676202 RepID=UPI0007857F48|nr:hypothetical protein [Demequina globuliformis]